MIMIINNNKIILLLNNYDNNKIILLLNNYNNNKIILLFIIIIIIIY